VHNFYSEQTGNSQKTRLCRGTPTVFPHPSGGSPSGLAMLCRKRHSFYQALRATGHPNPITTKHNIGTKIEINTDMPGLRPEPFFEELDTQTVPVRITQAVSNTQKRVISAGGAWPFVANRAPMRTYQTRRGEVLNASVRSEPFRVSIKRSRGVLGVRGAMEQ